MLDFYVHEHVQRIGLGRALLEAFMAAEGLAPELLAYDRPSDKLLGLLRKHYGEWVWTWVGALGLLLWGTQRGIMGVLFCGACTCGVLALLVPIPP